MTDGGTTNAHSGGNESPLKERNVQTLLSVLACALGPLDQEALLRLTRLSSTWDLVETLKPLDRFIVGDGKANGYAFSHPRLGYYFKERLSSTEQQDWEQRFLEWGKDTVEELEQGMLAPAKAPSYIVQYYGAHLDQTHASAEVQLTLVCQGWSKAWEALEGSFAGFLNDVEQAWKAAEFENEEATTKGQIAPRIGDEIRCALVRASINSLAANLPVELIIQLVKYQKWTFRQALSYAQQIPSVLTHASALARIATELKTSKDLRDQTLVEASSAARELGASGWEMLTVLAPHCPEVVLAATRDLKESALRAHVLAALAPYSPEAVLAAARELKDRGLPPQALAALAASQPEAVSAAARKLQDPGLRAHVLKALAPHCPEAILVATHELED